MNNAANNVAEIRNAYRALMTACLASKGGNAESFNNKVKGLIHELADGEAPDYSPKGYYRAAQEVAYYQYGVNFRNVAGCAV